MPLTVDQIKQMNFGYLTGADLVRWCAAAHLIKQYNVDPDSLQDGCSTAYKEVRNKLSTRYDITDELKNNGVINALATASQSAGAVNALLLANPGIGYVATPAVTIIDTGGAGAGATATASLVPTVVKNILVTTGGAGYSNPTVAIIGGLGIGGIAATAIATMCNGVITGIVLTSAGAGYISTPAITITDANGTGANAAASLVETILSGLTLTAGGAGYVTPAVIISGGLGPDTRETVLVKVVAIWAIRNILGNYEHISKELESHFNWADQEVIDIRGAQDNLELDAAAKCVASTARLVRPRFRLLG
jgi:hypothetical protein